MTNDEQIRRYAETLNRTAFELLSLLNNIDIEVKERRDKIHIMTPRRKKPKEGCIIQRKDRRFEGRYMQNGKQKSVYGRNYDDCYAKLNAAIEQRDNAVKRYTLLSWLSDYIYAYKQNEVAPKTYKQMQRNIELHIRPNISDKIISEIKPMDIQKLLISISSERTRETVYNLLSGAFRQALAERLIEYNPMLAVNSCKSEREKGMSLTLDEQAEFLQFIHGSKLESYYLFCLYSGCRRNEALTVCREDIDELRGVIHIKGTKTKLSDRFIPLFGGIRDILSVLPQSGKLFDFSADYVSKQFSQYCPGHTLKDLRHTFATRALEAEVPIKVVQVWLGHSKISTTADIYSDVMRELSLSEADKLDRYLKIDTDSDNET